MRKYDIVAATTEDKGNISDGYHTFNELYEHRFLLFIALIRQMPEKSWRANYHGDGTMYNGWFVAGIELPSGQITYHLPISKWKMLDDTPIKTLDRAHAYDGHTSYDVLDRLESFINNT